MYQFNVILSGGHGYQVHVETVLTFPNDLVGNPKKIRVVLQDQQNGYKILKDAVIDKADLGQWLAEHNEM